MAVSRVVLCPGSKYMLLYMPYINILHMYVISGIDRCSPLWNQDVIHCRMNDCYVLTYVITSVNDRCYTLMYVTHCPGSFGTRSYSTVCMLYTEEYYNIGQWPMIYIDAWNTLLRFLCNLLRSVEQDKTIYKHVMDPGFGIPRHFSDFVFVDVSQIVVGS